MWPCSSSTIDNGPPDWKEEPETSSNIFSGLLFIWMGPLFQRASYLNRQKEKAAIEQDDLVPLARMDDADAIQALFEQAHDTYVPPKDKKMTKEQEQLARLQHALIAVCKQRLITAGIIKFFNTSFQFTFPLLLNEILLYFESQQEESTADDQKYRGYWLSCLLLLFISCKAFSEAAYFHKVNRCAWRMKVAIAGAVYRKSLVLSASAQQGTTLGEMVNLMQIDATKVEAFVPNIHVIWDGAFQIAGYMTILGLLLGWPCLIGLILLIFAVPVMGKIMSRLMQVNRNMVQYTDDRVKTANEALQGISCVKLYTWEMKFAETLAKFRQSELHSLTTVAYLRAFSRAYMTALPTLTAVVTFIALVYGNTSVTPKASTLFAAVVAFDQLRFPLLFYPMTIANWAQAKVSLVRLSNFLGLGEIDTKAGTYQRTVEGEGKIDVQNVSLYWRDPSIPLTRAELLDRSNSQKSLSSLDNNSINSDSSSKGNSKTSKSSFFKKKKKAPSTNTDADNSVVKDEEEDLIYPRSVVSNLSLSVEPGQLCAIIGRVGSGKSSLCSGILQEMIVSGDKDSSKITLQGSVAYVAQSAWILNQTVRDNILFGHDYDEARYKKVLDVCQLTHDLKLLQNGDQTEIGERGINLSGGQKQRISLARAAYSQAQVVILDDPLSALDPQVAQRVFHDCIVDYLGEKTRLLVTNQLQVCLPHCDTVVALGRDGSVIEQGSYTEVMKDEQGEVRRLMAELQTNDENDSKKKNENNDALRVNEGETNGETTIETAKSFDTTGTNQSQEAQGEAATNNKNTGLVTKEEREVGSVKARIYFQYLQAGGGLWRFALVLVGYLLSTGAMWASSFWISIWSSDAQYERHSEDFYIAGYGILALVMGLFTFIRSYGMALFGVRASRKMHSDLVQSVLRAPMSFFDTTPTGRLLSRFSKDIHTLDHELTDFFDFVLSIVLQLVVIMITIIFVTPWFTLLFIPLTILYIRIMNHFRNVSRETKRLESLTRTPVYNHFSETLGGLSTIRAYGERHRFLQRFATQLNIHTRATYNNKTADRWLSSRLDLLGAGIAGGAALFCTQVVVSGASPNFASYAGISLSYAIGVTGSLQFVIRSLAQVEAAMNSCERIFYYTQQIPQEAPLETDVKPPSPEWPTQGGIVLNQLKMRYREETPLVLKGISVSITGGQRIGVVGRTGSGKSSLLLVLMRIVEPLLSSADDDPPLLIDDVDVTKLGLYDLRSKLGIIPQSPVLFSGTIRSNMDPFSEYEDDQIWSALEQCGMAQEIQNDLNFPVAEYGNNLSQGQRQLLCLGRALLRNCRVLLLDEATSSVDMETDVEIQRTIRQNFQNCTVLTIAHRIQTILDSDQILVMKDGQAQEFAPPQELLQDDTSLFAEIVRHSQQQQEQQEL